MKDIVRVAMPISRRLLFDYRLKPNLSASVGCRVLVPFGRNKKVALIVDQPSKPSIPYEGLKQIDSVIDDEPIINQELVGTLNWVSNYYHQPLGEVLWTALPLAIRKGRPQTPNLKMGVRLTSAGASLELEDFARAKVQGLIFEKLANRDSLLDIELLKSAGSSWRSSLKKMESRDYVEIKPLAMRPTSSEINLIQDLNLEQQNSYKQIVASLGRYASFLLHGVTGSGKTEVYLHAITEVLAQGGQALIMVPEISLSPQLLGRVGSALAARVVAYHSGLTDAERHRSWWLAKTGEAQVIVGTRSAVFLPIKRLSIIVMDEEHDSSFKQDEGVPYHARKVALRRAMTLGIPIVFGSATPSLETVQAAKSNRVSVLSLTKRATQVAMPTVQIIDLNNINVTDGMSFPLLKAIQKRLDANEQCLIFINRRGYSPLVFCADCQWFATCPNCDLKLIYHSMDNCLRCHQCGFKQNNIPKFCPQCESARIEVFGEGTQKVEQILRQQFPGVRLLRIDSDSIKGYAQIQSALDKAQYGDADILVGTQMLSKGHNFPYVTLVGILDADRGFFSHDFRAMEYLTQQVLQVAGRAGRIEKCGEVYIQSMYPTSDVFEAIRSHSYMQFAHQELENRKEAQQPPFLGHALLRANSPEQDQPEEFLLQAKERAHQIIEQDKFSGITVMDAIKSPIGRIANRHRAQLLVTGSNTVTLGRFLTQWVDQLEKFRKKGKLRWNLDVDPINYF